MAPACASCHEHKPRDLPWHGHAAAAYLIEALKARHSHAAAEATPRGRCPWNRHCMAGRLCNQGIAAVTRFCRRQPRDCSEIRSPLKECLKNLAG